jgi:phage shock protein PspC (stress-responsive transcriptional regulator)
MSESKLYRVKEGAILAGVCQGLEASGRGSAVAYRLLFAFGSIFWLIGIVIYIVMGISIPVASKEQLEQLQKAASENGSNRLAAGPSLDAVQVQLERIQKMKDDALISEDEATKLRAKALGIN